MGDADEHQFVADMSMAASTADHTAEDQGTFAPSSPLPAVEEEDEAEGGQEGDVSGVTDKEVGDDKGDDKEVGVVREDGRSGGTEADTNIQSSVADDVAGGERRGGRGGGGDVDVESAGGGGGGGEGGGREGAELRPRTGVAVSFSSGGLLFLSSLSLFLAPSLAP